MLSASARSAGKGLAMRRSARASASLASKQMCSGLARRMCPIRPYERTEMSGTLMRHSTDERDRSVSLVS